MRKNIDLHDLGCVCIYICFSDLTCNIAFKICDIEQTLTSSETKSLWKKWKKTHAFCEMMTIPLGMCISLIKED